MYSIEFSNSAGKELEKVYGFDQKLYARLIAAIESLKTDPYAGKKLKGPLNDRFSIRVGNYRIVYRLFKNRLVVYIIDLGHRKDIYR